MQRVLVTGATGFLGSWVVRSLCASGLEVRALVRDLARVRRIALAEEPRVVEGVATVPSEVELVRGDVRDRVSLRRAMRGVDAVIHTAGLISLRERDRDELFRVNTDGALNVAFAARDRGARLVHTSSIATVGTTKWPVACDERAPPSPVAGYAYVESKSAGERHVLRAAREGLLDAVALCPGIMLGPRDPRFSSTRVVRHYLSGELRCYISGGTSFCDVRDVAAACVDALRRGRSGERYIVAGINRTYRELLQSLWEMTRLYRPFPLNKPAADAVASLSDLMTSWFQHPFDELNRPVMAYAQRFNFCDSGKAMREIGYATRDFDATLAETIVDHLMRGVTSARTPELRALRESVLGKPTAERSARQGATA